ncbi:Hypothetical protein A7982_09635 [Minicystis rosea]|nr:Hypothetical protein A7982_09635 [Minicystis rosea]
MLAFMACRGGGEDVVKQSTIPHDARRLARAQGSRAALSEALEPVAFFEGAMPTGVTVSRDRRIFVSFPRWIDPVASTAAELAGGRLVPIPDLRMNQFTVERAPFTLVSVQSVVLDPENRVWLVDTGNVDWNDNLPDAPKLVAFDLRRNQVSRVIHFSPDVVLPTSYINDVRFDWTHGKAGTAYLTDASMRGPNGIIVVDLASGRAFRRLDDHPSTQADRRFTPTVEGEPLLRRVRRGQAAPLRVGVDGIALSADGKVLWYRPLVSRHLYSVSTDALVDESAAEELVVATVIDHGDLGYASDGLESDAEGRLYLTDYEHQAIHRLLPNGKDEVLVTDPRLIWPDTLALAEDGYLYVTVNQLNRQPQFHEGIDRREGPYALFRIKVDAKPAWLR